MSLTSTFLSLSALPAVGELLLGSRPAVVIAADGTRVMWANVAAIEALEAGSLAGLLRTRFGRHNPLVAQIARLSRQLPTGTARMEVLRIGQGVRLATMPAACRRLDLADGGRAVLAAFGSAGKRGSLRTRADELAEGLAEVAGLAAVLSADGDLLAAAGSADGLEPMEAELDRLIEHATAARGALTVTDLDVDDGVRRASIVRLPEGFLLVVPDHPVLRTAHADAPPPDTPSVAETDATDPADGADSRTESPPARLRFTWSRRGAAIDHVTAELASAVGDPNAALAGRTWPEIAGVLGFPAPPVAGSWSASVAWPVTGKNEAVRIDLAAFAGREGAERGFGTIYPAQRSADTRTAPVTLTEALDSDTSAEPGPEPGKEPGKRPDARQAPPTESDGAAPGLADAEPPAGNESPAQQDIDDTDGVSDTAAVGDTRPANDDAPPPARKDEATDAPAPPSAPDGADSPDEAAAADELSPPDEPGPPAPPLVDAPAETTRSTMTLENLDDEARRSVEDGGPAPVVSRAADNVVQLPRPEREPTLPPPEEDAFARIGRSLMEFYPGRSGTPVPEAAPSPTPPTRPLTREILDRVPLGLLMLRGDDMLFANRFLVDMLRYPDARALDAGGGARAIFPDHAAGWTEQNLSAHDGRLFARDYEGNTISVAASLHTVPWDDEPALMLALRPDRSDEAREEIAGELAEAMERIDELQAVLDTATDGTILLDRKGTITDLNRAAEALFGVDAVEMLGLPLTDLLAEESHAAASAYLDDLAKGIASDRNGGRDVVGLAADGRAISMFMSMGRIGPGSAFCAVLRDITHWKEAEKELIAARQEAESASEQKSEFLAKVSHEIRTPLNAIIGFAEVMAEERFGEIGNDRYRSYLRDIHASGEHLLSLINDLLDLSKIEAGKMELDFEAVSLTGLIQETVAMMQPQANRERIIIRTSLSPEVREIVADARSLKQILLNLLSNAIKFTAAGGQVIVSTGLEDTGEAVIRVRDTGIGMGTKDVEAAMQPFRQVAAVRRDGDRGTGLGLPLTKALAEANHAIFAIDSAVNQGTLVKITFPKAGAAA